MVDVSSFTSASIGQLTAYLHVLTVPKALVGNLQFWDDGQTKEGHRDERSLHRATSLGSHVAEQPAAVSHLMAVERRHQPCNGQRHLDDLLIGYDHLSPLHLYDTVDGMDDKLVGGADGHDVVTVMSH